MKKFFVFLLVFAAVSTAVFARGRGVAAVGPYGPIAASGAGPFALNVNAASQLNPNIRNIILLIPDGTSQSAYTLARWFKSYDPATGEVDPAVKLNLDSYASGLVRTWWRNAATIGPVTDSAPASTAMATGFKTDDNFIGMSYYGRPLATVLYGARHTGRATGLIATSNIQHATPAAFASHFNHRDFYDIIGEQQVFNQIDVVFGGGASFLQPPFRQDGRNLIDELRAMGYQIVTTRDEMLALSGGRVWGLFAGNALAYELDRPVLAPHQPSLSEMTSKAIELLNQNPNGFFLMVEGSTIDWAAHANDPVAVATEVLEFDRAFAVAIEFARVNPNTLVLVASDHGTGGLSIGDMQTAGLPPATWTYSFDPVQRFVSPLHRARLTAHGVLSKLDADRTNVVEVMSEWLGIDDLTAAEIAAIQAAHPAMFNFITGPMISRRANIGWTTHGHTGEETNLFSYFPGGSRLVGTIQNTDIARVIAGIMGVDLAALTEALFVEAAPVFIARGASVEVDTSVRAAGTMTVTRGGSTLVIPENRNYVIFNGERVTFTGVVVNQDGTFFVPQPVIDLIP